MQLFFEIKQMRKNWKDYFFTQDFIWNFLDLSSSILVLMFSFIVLSNLNLGRLVLLIGAFASFLIWLKLFYYLRIFGPTASFIRMIIEMFKDIRVFLLIFFIGIFAFSTFYYMLDKGHEDKVIGFSGGSYLGAVIYTYM